MAITHLDRQRDSVFSILRDPDCRFALLRPVSTAYESWRVTATLAPKFQARIKAWPIETTLLPGIALGAEQGLESWDAEHALAGLMARDPSYLELASHILESSAGCSLDLSGGVKAVIVAERHFQHAVDIGDPVHLLGSQS
jgi:hypothetical protein